MTRTISLLMISTIGLLSAAPLVSAAEAPQACKGPSASVTIDKDHSVNVCLPTAAEALAAQKAAGK